MRMMTDDNDLAERAGAGDAQAFRVLLERHYDRIYRLAYRFYANAADAEDTAQDICVALPVKLKSFNGRARFTTWLYKVVINACRDQIRNKSNRARLDQAYSEVEDLNRAGAAATNREVDWLYDMLERLDPALKETAIIVLGEQQTHAQAAQILGIKEATVSWRMHELRKKLKVLAEAGDGDLE